MRLKYLLFGLIGLYLLTQSFVQAEGSASEEGFVEENSE